MVNTGAVSRGQFGQVVVPAVAEVVSAPSNNAYISQSPAKQEVRENVEKDEKVQQRPNNKKRKHKEQREQHHHTQEPQQQQQQPQQVHEEVVQLSRQEQRELKRQQKRPHPDQPHPQHQNDGQQTENAVPRRDRNNQQRPNRPNRHRDPSVLNENQNAPAPVVVDEKQIKVDLIDAPKHEVMNTALVINVDQAQSEIIALTPEQPVKRTETAPVVEVVQEPAPAPIAVVEETVTAEAEETTPPPAHNKNQPQIQRASNDPRMRRREQRNAKRAKAAVPSIAPSQIPTLAQYTIGSLIRHVYGEDCTVLIEQFGLVPTFNRALLKFAEQYASTLVTEVASDAEDKKPVTRDAELPSNKPSQEAEPAPVLALTPQKESTPRVANDPRERRRLAKLAAEQAFEQVKQQHSAPEEAAPVAPVVEETVVAPVAETQAPVESKQQPLELDQVTEVAQSETSAEEVPATTVVEAPAVKQPRAKAKAATEQAVAPVEANAEVESEDSKADLDKPNRPPRRPRGRPPKKANPVAE